MSAREFLHARHHFRLNTAQWSVLGRPCIDRAGPLSQSPWSLLPTPPCRLFPMQSRAESLCPLPTLGRQPSCPRHCEWQARSAQPVPVSWRGVTSTLLPVSPTLTIRQDLLRNTGTALCCSSDTCVMRRQSRRPEQCWVSCVQVSRQGCTDHSALIPVIYPIWARNKGNMVINAA